MVSGVRVRVPPLPFCSHFQVKYLGLITAALIECGIHHNGFSREVFREEVVKAHGGLTVYGRGDVSVGQRSASPRKWADIDLLQEGGCFGWGERISTPYY